MPLVGNPWHLMYTSGMRVRATLQQLPITRKHLRGVVQIVISAVLLVIVVRQISWAELRAAIVQMDLAWLGVAWGLFLLGMVVRALRWQVLLDDLALHRPLRELTVWYFIASFFNVLLPTGFGGDAVRVLGLGQDTRQMGPVLNSVVVDRYLGLMALLAMGLAAGLLRPDLAPAAVVGLIAVLLVAGVVAAWLLSRPWWATWSQQPGRFPSLLRLAGIPRIAAALTQYRPQTIVRALLISLLFNLLLIGWNAALGFGLGLRLPPVLYFVFVPLTSVVLLLPAFGGLGVRELTYVTLFGSVGIAPATALALSLGVYAITVATGLIGGALYLLQGIRHTRGKS